MIDKKTDNAIKESRISEENISVRKLLRKGSTIFWGILFVLCSVTCTGCSNKEATENAKIQDEAENPENTEIQDEAENPENTELQNGPQNTANTANPKKSPVFIEKMELKFAKEFSVDIYDEGYACIHISDGNDYVLVPQGQPEIDLESQSMSHNLTYIHQPCDTIYLAATAAMDQFHVLDSLESIKACSTTAEDYADDLISQMINDGRIQYVGKYRAPDYEKLLELGTNLVIESTMIYHSPKIKEELESMDIPVLVEKSSYENHPLGRLEWIKLYGLLMGKYDEANAFFEKTVSEVETIIESLPTDEKNRPKVVFFYLSSNGYVNVRKPGDYISQMIEMAGGEYALDSLNVEEENALSTVNISWEDFYVYAKDADILIYNGTIDGGILTKDELLRQNSLFQEFEAIKNDRLYCTENNMFQEVSKTGEIIQELYAVINQKDLDCRYIRNI